MVCKKCGFQNLQGSMYCSGCGANLQNSSEESKNQKHKFTLGLIAVMMIFAAVMAIVSAGNGAESGSAKAESSIPITVAPEPSYQEIKEPQIVTEPTHQETEASKKNPEPAYINEIVALGGRNGLVWTRSTAPVNYGFEFTNEDAPECWGYSDNTVGGHTPGVVIDNWGNVYEYGIHVDGDKSEAYYFSVDLFGEYSTFAGTVACPEKGAAISEYVYKQSTAYTKYFEVYGDGVLLYTSPTIRYDYPPQDFTVDITGVDRLTIVYPATKGPNEIATIYDGVVS